MITFRRLSYRSSYNKRSSINSVSNDRCSAGSFVSSGYRLYSRYRGRSSSNKSGSGSSSSGRRRRRRRRSLVVATGTITAGTVAGSLDGSG